MLKHLDRSFPFSSKLKIEIKVLTSFKAVALVAFWFLSDRVFPALIALWLGLLAQQHIISRVKLTCLTTV